MHSDVKQPRGKQRTRSSDEQRVVSLGASEGHGAEAEAPEEVQPMLLLPMWVLVGRVEKEVLEEVAAWAQPEQEAVLAEASQVLEQEVEVFHSWFLRP